MIAIAVSNDGDRPSVRSLEIVDRSRPVRIAKVPRLMRCSAMASRSQPPKSPSVIRLGRSRSSTSRCPQRLDSTAWAARAVEAAVGASRASRLASNAGR